MVGHATARSTRARNFPDWSGPVADELRREIEANA